MIKSNFVLLFRLLALLLVLFSAHKGVGQKLPAFEPFVNSLDEGLENGIKNMYKNYMSSTIFIGGTALFYKNEFLTKKHWRKYLDELEKVKQKMPKGFTQADKHYILKKYYWCKLNEVEFNEEAELNYIRGYYLFELPVVNKEEAYSVYSGLLKECRNIVEYLSDTVNNAAYTFITSRFSNVEQIRLEGLEDFMGYEDIYLLKEELEKIGITREQSLESIVIQVFWSYLKNKPYDIIREIEYFKGLEKEKKEPE
ncbi:MAG: hypothetical protein OEW75_10850 [Cyclobacteriaceae bacterium]|nr:hypothetical protein [Cyclobacteriaceae bacterium]